MMARVLNPEKRKAYLQAALRLFVANGVSNTSTAQVAAEAGTAAGTLFLYFPTRQDLLDQLVLEIGREASTYTQAQLQSDLPVRQMFAVIYRSTIDWFLAHPDAYQYLLQVRDTGLISPAASAESAAFFGYYYTAIQKGLAEEAIKPYPLGLIGDFLYQDIVAVLHYLGQMPGKGEREEVIRQGFDIFWDGIRSRE